MADAFVYRNRLFRKTDEKIDSAKALNEMERNIEWDKYQASQKAAVAYMQKQAHSAHMHGNEERANICDMKRMLFLERDFEEGVRTLIFENGQSAISAVLQTCKNIAEMFADMNDDYIRQRETDIMDMAAIICRYIDDSYTYEVTIDSPCVLLSYDLTPAQMLALNTDMVKGIVLRKGAVNSHTAILARAAGIPLIVACDYDRECDGRRVIVDADNGVVHVNPDESVVKEYEGKIAKAMDDINELEKYRELKAKSHTGKVIDVYCNIGGPADMDAVLSSGGEGIGLYRTEFLYLTDCDFPSELKQYNAYRDVITAMGDKEVIIRTCDLGSDKQVEYLGYGAEANSAMGMRAIRMCLDRREMFKTQIRALYRASKYGNLSIMFPMIASEWEFDEARKICLEVIDELRGENGGANDKYDEVRLGVLIETPAAALISKTLAKKADFFSIGTNDLAQYTLACDRQNPNLGRFFDPHHPAVLGLIKMAADSAHEAGIRVGICGELAADETLIDFFTKIGIDELSVSPNEVLRVKKNIITAGQ